MTHLSISDKPRIGITLGDVNGIGPEVVLKVFLKSDVLQTITPIVYGSIEVLSYYRKILQLTDVHYHPIANSKNCLPHAINLVDCLGAHVEITPGIPSSDGGKAALLGLQQAVYDIRKGYIEAMVTGPIDKNTIYGEDFPYHGHTEYLNQIFTTTKTLMLMVSQQVKIGLVTEHIPIREVAAHIRPEQIASKIEILEETMKRDFQVVKPRIAILGLNPHAGDNGLLGYEEKDIIQPVIDRLNTFGKLIYGPFSADGFFATQQHAKYDATMAMYHDQGLIAFKTLTFASGVNYTAGLPIVRTAPDHGTAYPIVGKNVANENSMKQAIFLAAHIVRQRKQKLDQKN